MTLLVSLVVDTARAHHDPPQAFPDRDAWTAVAGGEPSIFGDAVGDVDQVELDVVGDDEHPSTFTAVENGYLFMRMRLDADPCETRVDDECVGVKSWGWVFALDGDGDGRTFENIVELQGNSGQSFEWRRNTELEALNAPQERAEVLIDSFDPVPAWFRVSLAPTVFRGTPDYFLAMALPCGALEAEQALGALYSCSAPLRLWAGTNTNKHNVSADSGFDVNVDTDGDGIFDPLDPAPTDPCNPDPDAVACPTGDADGDGVPNDVDPDALDPCVPDANALACKTGDADGDGVANGDDPAPLNPCIPDTLAPSCPLGDVDPTDPTDPVDPNEPGPVDDGNGPTDLLDEGSEIDPTPVVDSVCGPGSRDPICSGAQECIDDSECAVEEACTDGVCAAIVPGTLTGVDGGCGCGAGSTSDAALPIGALITLAALRRRRR